MGWWIFGVSVVVIVPFLFFLTIGGSIQGEEFSPDDFSRRRFTYNVAPLFGWRLQGIQYDDKTPVLEQTLLTNGYLGKNAAKTAANKRWHLVYDNGSNLESRDFDARLLIRFLDLNDGKHESFWMKWNDDRPDLADEFWPVVAEMARNYLYVDLTDIMARATKLSDSQVEDFRAYMKERAATAFCNLAERQRKELAYRNALTSYETSLKYAPSEAATKGKRECLEHLPDSEESIGDNVSLPAEAAE